MHPVDHLVRPRGVHKERVRREDVLDGRRDTHYVLATIAAVGSSPVSNRGKACSKIKVEIEI